MKKLLFSLALSALSIVGFSQPTLYFRITAPVITTDGRTISTNAVVSFVAHTEGIANAKLPCDLNWWISDAAQDSSYAKIIPITKLYKGTLLNVAYLPVSVPPQQFTYDIFQAWAKTWLEGVYGSGKVIILN